jgi:hypothetical protein
MVGVSGSSFRWRSRNITNFETPRSRLNTDFIVKFYECHDTSWVMASWWREDKKYTNRSTDWYQTTNLREPYIYLMALICRLYGEKDCSIFSEAWMPLAYIVAISRSNFNWGAIISKQLSICIQQAQTPKEGETPTFYMASYLLDVMCARNIFSGMNLSWHMCKTPGPRIFQHLMGEQVQEILLPHLR